MRFTIIFGIDSVDVGISGVGGEGWSWLSVFSRWYGFLGSSFYRGRVEVVFCFKVIWERFFILVCEMNFVLRLERFLFI